MFELVLFVLYLVFIPVFYGKILYFWQYHLTKNRPNQEFWQKFRDSHYNSDVFFSLFFAITWPVTILACHHIYYDV